MADTTPSQIDVQTPFDPTGQSTITGAGLQQFGSGITPYDDKGIIMSTDDIAGVPQPPDAATYTKWQNYLWLRKSATSVGVYAWNNTAASDPTYLKWTAINVSGVGAGSITTDMIADLAVTDSKITSIDGSKITGSLSGAAAAGLITTSTTLVGDVGGTPLANVIGNNAITTAKIADANVTGAKLEAGSQTTGVPVTKLQCDGSAEDMTRTNAGATAMEFFTPNALTKLSTAPAAAVTLTGNSLKLLRVNAGETAYELVTPASSGITNVLQSKAKAVTTTNGPTLLPLDNTLPVVTEGVSLISLAFTPISASSILKITLTVMLASANAGDTVSLALFQDNTCIQAMAHKVPGANEYFTLNLDCVIASPGTSAVTFSVRFGPDTAGHTVTANGLFDTAGKSFLTITELVGTLS